MDRFTAILVELNDAFEINRDLVDKDYARLTAQCAVPNENLFIFSDPVGQPAELPPLPPLPSWEDGTTLGENLGEIVAALETDVDLVPIDEPNSVAQHVEPSLAALRQNLSALLAVRTEYTGLAKDYVDFKIRIEEFNRLDLITRTEIAQGFHERDYADARDDISATGAGSFWHRLGVVEHGIVQVPPALTGTRTEQINEMGATATASNFRHSAFGTVAKTRVLQRRLALSYQEIALRRYRNAVARDAIAARYREFMRDGSALNFLPRLTAMQALYRRQLVRVLSLIGPISRGLASTYGISAPVLDLRVGAAADGLGAWLVEVTEALRMARQKEQVTLRRFPLSLMVDDWRNDIGNGLSFQVAMPNELTEPHRLRGIGAEFVGQAIAPMSLAIEPPTEAPNWPDGLDQGHLPELILGRVANAALGIELAIEHVDLLWNAAASGRWHVRLNGTFDIAQVDDVIVYLKVASS